jgi:asparagine synthase (glutamine-hydrolysing)
MCGICGIFTTRGHNVSSGVARMMHAMVHRGPDDQGYEEISLGSGDGSPTIGLGFRRLAIIDLTPTGHQPMFNPDTGDCIVFNGEIYNFQSLRTELQCEGVRFRGTSDTEVLLHALSKWGESALTRIAGMYAFAFYEAKTQRVLLARDPLGIKPLYIAEVADGVVFSS